MAMHRGGFLLQPAISKFSAIQQATHIARAAYGCSEAKYGVKEDFSAPVMGVGQGNGAVPPI